MFSDISSKNKLYIFVVGIILTAFLFVAGCGGDPIGDKIIDMDKKISDIDQRMSVLESKSTISNTQTPTNSSIDNSSIDPLNPDAGAITNTNTANDLAKVEAPILTEYAFESCQDLKNFNSQEWLPKFKASFQSVYPPRPDQYYPNFDKLTEACYSSVGNTLFAIQPAVSMNNGFHMFKYDIKTNKVSESSIQSFGLGSFATPTEFKRREGSNINMFGYADQNSCKLTTSFKFDYTANNLVLKEDCSKCGAEKEVCKAY